MAKISREDSFNTVLFWLGVVCIGCAWTCWSGVYVSTYRLTTYESWFAYVLASAGMCALTFSLRKFEINISSKYLRILIPLILYGLLIPYPYSLGPWVLISGLALFYVGRKSTVVRSMTPGILLSGLLLTVESFLVPLWYYIGCHSRGLPWLASVAARVFSLLGRDCSFHSHTLFAKSFGDYRIIQVTADAVGLLPGLFILIGIALCWSFRDQESRSWRDWGGIVLLWMCYLLARYMLFLWIFLGWSEKTNITMMWNAVYCVLSFAPLAIILTVFKYRVNWTGKAHLSWNNISRNMLAWMILASFAIMGAIFGSSLTDPGHEKRGRILIDEGHSSWEDTTRTFDTNWYGQASTYNYYCLRKFLENYYAVTVNTVTITPEVLANLDIVILKCPTHGYGKEELHALEAYVREGGGLFLVGDHTDVFGTSTNFNHLAERFGLSFHKDGQWDIYGQFSVYKQPQTMGHPVGRHTPEFLFATGCTLGAAVWHEKPIIGYGMMTRLADYKNKNFFPDEAHFEDREFGLFLQVAGAFEGKGRVLCFSDSTVWSNFSMFLQGKPELLLDCLMWLNRSNTWWASVKPWGLLVSVILAVAAVFLSPSLEVIKKHHGSIISCVIAVIVLSCFLVDWIHGQAYKLPEAVQDYRKVTFDCEHSDIFLANRQWFPEEPHWEALDYGAFFLAAQRLSFVPKVGHSLFQALGRERDPIVFINPHKPFSEKEVALFHDYVSKGGKALVLDSGERGNDSFAENLIGPLSVEILFTEPSAEKEKENNIWAKYMFSEDKDHERSVSFSTQGVCEVSGGEPRLWYTVVENRGDVAKERWKPCLTEVSLGKGKVWVCTLSRAFSGAGLGNSSTIPNKEQQNIYRLAYKVLTALAGE